MYNRRHGDFYESWPYVRCSAPLFAASGRLRQWTITTLDSSRLANGKLKLLSGHPGSRAILTAGSGSDRHLIEQFGMYARRATDSGTLCNASEFSLPHPYFQQIGAHLSRAGASVSRPNRHRLESSRMT